MVRLAKDVLGLRHAGVYQNPCECGRGYIGQTGRLIQEWCIEPQDQPKKIWSQTTYIRILT